MTVAAPTPFTIRPDGNFNIQLTRAWLTDVMSNGQGSETRVKVRHRAPRRLEFTARMGSPEDAGQFLVQWTTALQPLRYYVPLWPDGIAPTADIGSGASEIFLETATREFEEN